MTQPAIDALLAEISGIQRESRIGRISQIHGGTVSISGLSQVAGLGDLVEISHSGGRVCRAEVLGLAEDRITVLPDGTPDGLGIGDRATLVGPPRIAPDESWLGRVIDPFGRPLDGRPLMRGVELREIRAAPPPATERRALGTRLETGLCVFNTLLPIVRGQRVGLFAGSGVGKSRLLGQLAGGLQSDVAVIALIGERGREVREFVERVLGPARMARSVVIAATSDQSSMVRRRAAWSAMSVAEFFRDSGQQVLFLADSITRFAEAHREVALAAGEQGSLRGYPPSTAQMIMSLAERAGPGCGDAGDITAVFSVLVAGSDMEEPVADIMRGVLDGHVVLDRRIAERGRFPAIDLLRSVSRSLPDAASPEENELIASARRLLGAYDKVEVMLQAGLYTPGTDPETDAAIAIFPELDRFLATAEDTGATASFDALRACLSGARGDDQDASEGMPALTDGQPLGGS